MAGINMERLTETVEKLPEIYNPSMPSYCNSCKIKAVWQEINRHVITVNWENLLDREQEKKIGMVYIPIVYLHWFLIYK